MSKLQEKIMMDLDPAALTPHLHLRGKTEKTGNQDGYSVAPIETDWRKPQL